MTIASRPHRISADECERFKRLRQVHSLCACADILGRDRNALAKLERRGFVPHRSERLRARPSDFALLADKMRIKDLARHYRTGADTVRRWAREIGRKSLPRGKPRPKPCPPDLADRIARLGVNGARRTYGVHQSTFERWREQAGLPVMRKRETPGLVGWADRYAAERRANLTKQENSHV